MWKSQGDAKLDSLSGYVNEHNRKLLDYQRSAVQDPLTYLAAVITFSALHLACILRIVCWSLHGQAYLSTP